MSIEARPFDIADRVEGIVREHSFASYRRGYVEVIDPDAYYPIMVRLDTTLDNGEALYCFNPEELTHVEEGDA